MPHPLEDDAAVVDRNRQIAPQIYEVLRQKILTLQLPPGTLLSRAKLREEFGVSQTPIRDALLRLSSDSLVDIFAQHATIVRPIDLAHARESHYLRLSVELEVVRQLAQQDDKGFVGPIRSLLEQQTVIVETQGLDAYRRSDLTFHEDLCNAAGVRGLWVLIRRRGAHLDRLRRLDRPQGNVGLRDHFDILDAIKAGDATGAQALIRQHLSRTLARVDEIRARHPTFLK